jgi:hypothetical protein
MIVTLSQPVSITGSWENQYYDATHNHFLCVQENKLFIFSLEELNPTAVQLFQHSYIIPKYKLMKLSLNRELLAAQLYDTSLLIIDLTSDKKWKIELKNGSEILANGVIWSEHGGNSEDLIIVTNKGLELYKINNKKSYCKLSRTVAQSIMSYWYNVEYRMILIATAMKSTGATAPAGDFFGFSAFSREKKETVLGKGNQQENLKKLLLMDGYYFKAERSAVPMLELPPPDKIPRFELGPGVTTDCIHLLNVYDKLLTLVRYNMNNSDGYFGVYSITKTSVEKLFSLSVGSMTKEIKLSTFDNLIVCHDLASKLSYVYDIQKLPREKASRASSATIDPLVAPSVISYTCRYVEEEMALLKLNEIKTANKGRRPSQHVIPSSSLPPLPPLSTTGSDGTFYKNGTGNGIQYNHASSSLLEEYGIPDLRKVNSLKFSSSSDADLSDFDNPDDSDNSRINVDESYMRFDYVETDEPRPAYPFYSDAVYEWYDSNIAYEIDSKVIWKVQVHFQNAAKAIEDFREKILFLCRRGRKYSYPARSLLHQSSNKLFPSLSCSEESQSAKVAVLKIVYDCIEQKLPLSYYHSLFYGLNNSLILENYRYLSSKFIVTPSNSYLENVDYELVDYLHAKFIHTNDLVVAANSSISSSGVKAEASSTAASGIVKPSVSSSTSFTASISTTSVSSSLLTSSSSSTVLSTLNRRQSIGEKVFQRVMNRSSIRNIDSSLLLDNDSSNPLEIEPIELTSTSVLPSVSSTINIVCSKAKAFRNNGNKTVPNVKATDASSPDMVRQLSSQAAKSETIPLSTRRNEIGDLIVTQTEMLSYIFLPFLMGISHKMGDYEYLSEVMTLYLSSILDQGIDMVSSIAYLHVQLLFSLGKYNELANLTSISFYNDSVHVARSLLDFVSLLEEDAISFDEKYVGEVSYEYPNCDWKEEHNMITTCIEKFRISALQVLWKLNEHTTVVKTYLTQGLITEAMELCQQHSVAGKDGNNGVLPNSLSGAEFLYATFKFFEEETLQTRKKKMTDMEKTRLLYSVYCFIITWDKGAFDKSSVSVISILFAIV